ncbi:MAG TPA: AAA family ATPase [Candidatus Bilamarchaeaceae archaeon]|nr:AAA family ATPase [Candidatus Bilamarchaeaceae archaeon]
MASNSFEEILSKKSIFQDVSVLSPHFVPEKLPFREEQIGSIMKTISPALKGQKPRNLFIYGTTGTGKTCCTKWVMEAFNKVNQQAHMLYLNCRVYNSRYRILQKVLKEFVPECSKSGFGLTFLYEKLLELIDKKQQMVVILDEIDMIKDLDDLIYTMTRANDEIRNKGGVSLVGISNRLSFKDALDPRSKSSLSEIEMIFPPYTSEQLQEILVQRLNGGFVDGVVTDSAINLAAAITSQTSGDARYALKLLLKAGEIAEQENKEKLTDEEVEHARRMVELDLASETIVTLPENHQMVLHAIAKLTLEGGKYERLEGLEQGFLFSGEVYEEYESVCKKLNKRPRSLRWYKEYLNDIELLGLISTKPSSTGIRGHTTLIKLGHPAENILKIVKKILVA